ncbi:hypothetical protein [Nonomuraea typhae]|uniref:DUF86 domain-containing protein n=1 Tax=Nonomuraea typhae TaxID=2603600 RepID=A0ABW7Z976_9ACTN
MDEGMSQEDWHVREVYAYFGLAMYHAQVLEHGIVNLVVWTGVGDGTYRTYAETEAANKELFSRSMDRIRTVLLKRRTDLTHLEGDLLKALRLRNFLAHDYFRERSAAALESLGRDHMLTELRLAVELFREVDAKLVPLTRAILMAKGIGAAEMAEALDACRAADFGAPLPGL